MSAPSEIGEAMVKKCGWVKEKGNFIALVELLARDSFHSSKFTNFYCLLEGMFLVSKINDLFPFGERRNA